jgi:hypothetical protein
LVFFFPLIPSFFFLTIFFVVLGVQCDIYKKVWSFKGVPDVLYAPLISKFKKILNFSLCQYSNSSLNPDILFFILFHSISKFLIY